MDRPGSSFRKIASLLAAFILLSASLCACTDDGGIKAETDTSEFIVTTWDEPSTYDFQCTTIYYNTAYCVFDRLVKMERGRNDRPVIKPSLAESWEISADGRSYSFHLREGVKFNNGAELTSSDVEYTLTRLLTHPHSSNRDIAECILGAGDLESGKAKTLEGFSIKDDLNFTITLSEPFEAFLACMSMPGASILDEESTEAAGDSFGQDIEAAAGTGPYVLRKWEKGRGMLFEANPDCWAGPPKNKGLDVRFVQESEELRRMFDEGEIDILDLSDLDSASEYYIHGDIYEDRLYDAPQVGITYIALNESAAPLDDVRVRKALQLATDRNLLLESVYGGRGEIENGLFPRGLYGHNPDLSAIPYDADEAASLLAQAGYPEGFDLTFSVRTSSSQGEMDMVRLIAEMWEKIGVKVKIEVLGEDEFMSRRKNGELSCYEATWIADFNDPDNFAYTFFGNRANSVSRSLCYNDESTMKRVRKARTIQDKDKRIEEYRDLEKKIVQEDCAWVPLLSRTRYYVTSERLKGFHVAWTGRVFINYRDMSIAGS